MTDQQKAIKNQVQSFIATHGLVNNDLTIDGVRWSVLGPTRFHNGQVTIILFKDEGWITDFNRAGKPCTPQHVKQIPTGGWTPFEGVK